MPTNADLAGLLSETLRLSQPPIAVRFADSVPEGVRMFDGTVPAGCRFWQEAARDTFATVAHHHRLCGIGLHTTNLEQTLEAQRDLADSLKVFAQLGYVREQDIPQIPVLNKPAKVVIYGPLADTVGAPDVVLLFARADQTLLLSEASQQLEGGLPPAMGRPACAVIPQAVNTGRTALSLGCCGARAYLDVLTPEVALYAVPGPILEAFSERVATLARANSVLTDFHTARRRDIEAGERPSVQESLAALTR